MPLTQVAHRSGSGPVRLGEESRVDALDAEWGVHAHAQYVHRLVGVEWPAAAGAEAAPLLGRLDTCPLLRSQPTWPVAHCASSGDADPTEARMAGSGDLGRNALAMWERGAIGSGFGGEGSSGGASPR